jgi:hypothetical protein
MPRVSLSILSTPAAVLLFLSFTSAQTSQPEAAATPTQITAAGEKGEAKESIAPQKQVERPASVLIFARSDTVYMKSATIRSWLQRQPEFSRLRLAFAADQRHADYYVEVTRPVFTWDWTYCVVKTGSGKVVASGKVTAATAEHAAEALAPKIIQVLYGETSEQQIASGTNSSTETTAVGIRPKKFLAYEELARKFESAKTVSIRSLTVWLEESDLAQALGKRPEFSAWGYELVTPGKYQTSSGRDVEIGALPDLTIEVNRPLFTWDWTFSIEDRKAKQSLASGKLTAISGPTAAPELAQAIVGAIANARGLPASMQRQFDQALAETKVRTWNVKHVSGQSHLKNGKSVQLAVGQRTIFARDGDNIMFSVPVENLLQVSYSATLRDRSVKWFEGWEKAGNTMFSGVGAGDDPGSAVGALMVMLPMLAVEYGVGGLLKGSSTSDHFLRLDWKDDAVITTATFRGSEKEIREICAELDKFSKRSAVDLDAATQKLRTEIDQQLQSTNYSVKIGESVTFDNSVMPPGEYRVVMLPREKNLAEVYFLQGPDNAIAVRTMAQYARRTDADRSPRVSYGMVSGLQTLQEIRIDELILIFSPVPVVPEEVRGRDEDD